jgi:ADP-ribose pyrophosphatase YjhB (NUDIX family)
VSSILQKEPPSSGEEYRFCPRCGGRLTLKLLKAGDPERLVCSNCEFVFFLDPKVAAGTIFTVDGKIILGRRAIEPSYGKWVFPGGFVDRGETIEAAALRETREEMNVEVELAGLLNVYSYPSTPVIVLVFAAEVIGGKLMAADECLEVRGYEPGQIPWEELAFTSTRDAIRDYIRRFMSTTGS